MKKLLLGIICSLLLLSPLSSYAAFTIVIPESEGVTYKDILYDEVSGHKKAAELLDKINDITPQLKSEIIYNNDVIVPVSENESITVTVKIPKEVITELKRYYPSEEIVPRIYWNLGVIQITHNAVSNIINFLTTPSAEEYVAYTRFGHIKADTPSEKYWPEKTKKITDLTITNVNNLYDICLRTELKQDKSDPTIFTCKLGPFPKIMGTVAKRMVYTFQYKPFIPRLGCLDQHAIVLQSKDQLKNTLEKNKAVQNNEQQASKNIDMDSADNSVENKEIAMNISSRELGVNSANKSVVTNFNGQSAQTLGIEADYFSGNQRSAMLFGNQIEDAADSISVPDADNQNKVVASVAKPQLNFEPCATSAEEFDKTAKLYYVLLNRTALKNFTDVCESSGVTPVICPPSKHIEEMGKVGVIVEPKAKADTMLLETIRNFNGRPLKDVVLIVSVMNLDLKSRKIVEVHDQIRGDFNKCFETLNKMIKHPFGQRATMFRNIAKTFPGMLEKLPVSDIEANGKIYKQFDSPVVNIQLAAPGMNGEGKHVVLFHDSFVYMFVKYLPKQIRK